MLAHLEDKGLEGRVVSIDHLDELREGVEGYHREGLIDNELYDIYMTGFDYETPEDLPDTRTLIIAASPQPGCGVTFHRDGKTHRFIIPPTYLRYPDDQVKTCLSEVLDDQGYHLVRAIVPVKLLAVRSGLGEYGKNNICYVPGMRSFLRLIAFYSDLPLTEDSWREPKMLEECENCSACLRGCPSGAIQTDRFLLNAGRCITFHNEKDGDFADWIDPSWHNSLIGCMYCQNVCPVNKDFKDWTEDRASFSDVETELILKAGEFKQLPPETQKKLSEVEWDYGPQILARNLRAVLHASR